MTRFVVALIALLLPGVAFAQSNPGWVNGEVHSADEWNSLWSGKLDVGSNADLIAKSLVVGAPTGGNQGTGTLNAQGLFINGVSVGIAPNLTSPGPIGTVTPAPIGMFVDLNGNVNQTINPTLFGPGGTPVDRTGATDTQSAFLAAITAACAAVPVRSVRIPPGTYLFASSVTIPTGCNNLTIAADPGSVTLRVATTNTSNRALFNATGMNFLKFTGIIFDGNSPASANTNGLIGINAPMVAPEFDHCEFINSGGTAIWAVGGTSPLGKLSANAFQGDTTLTFAATPAGAKPGAYFFGTEIDPDIYITAADATTVTLSKPLTDTLLVNSGVHLTPAFTTSADAGVNGVTLATTDTSGLTVGQTIYVAPLATGDCITRNSRIVSIVANTSLTIDQPLTCRVPSGTNIAAIAGISRMKVTNSRFENLGMNLATAGSAVYTTVGAVTASATVTFACRSGVNCAQVGLIPGNTTAATGLPAGVPANNLVLTGPTIASSAGTFTVVFANPMTVASGTPIPFTVAGPSGNGYAVYHAFGAWFANTDSQVSHNLFRHTWSSPVFIHNSYGMLISDNSYRMDWQEFQAPNIAPSACVGPSLSIDLTIDGDNCSGATGNGIEGNHSINPRITNTNSSGNGTAGIFMCGGRNLSIINSTASRNGQIVNHPLTQQIAAGNRSGIQIGGSCTYSRSGDMPNVLLSNLILTDDQAIPTQNYGVFQWNKASTLTNLVAGPLVASGNIIASYDPALGLGPVPPLGVDNRIINPCFTIDQSNQGAAIRPGGNIYGPDQWTATASPNNITYQQSGALSTCANSEKMTVTVQATPTAAQFSFLQQKIETQTLSDLKWGSGAAKSIVVDFCASASTARTYGWGIQNVNGAHLRTYASSYTITAPATPQCFSFIVPGDTASTLPSVPTATGFILAFDAGSGSNFYTASCNAWSDTVTGSAFCAGSTVLETLAAGQSISISAVRLYPATVDSTWVQRSASDELALVNRYFFETFLGTVPAQNAGTAGAFCSQVATPNQWTFAVPMRIVPTITTYNPSAANANWRDVTAGSDLTVTVNSDGSETGSQVLLESAAIPNPGDVICIHATANARL